VDFYVHRETRKNLSVLTAWIANYWILNLCKLEDLFNIKSISIHIPISLIYLLTYNFSRTHKEYSNSFFLVKSFWLHEFRFFNVKDKFGGKTFAQLHLLQTVLITSLCVINPIAWELFLSRNSVLDVRVSLVFVKLIKQTFKWFRLAKTGILNGFIVTKI